MMKQSGLNNWISNFWSINPASHGVLKVCHCLIPLLDKSAHRPPSDRWDWSALSHSGSTVALLINQLLGNIWQRHDLWQTVETPVMLRQEWMEVESLCCTSGPLTLCKYLAAKWSLTGTFTYLGLPVLRIWAYDWVSILNEHNSLEDVATQVPIYIFHQHHLSRSHAAWLLCFFASIANINRGLLLLFTFSFSRHTLINLSHHIQIKLNSKAEISKGHLQLLWNLCPVLLQILKRACTCRAMAVIQTV